MKHGAIILCGGMSSRMGRPKALLPWRGRTMIEHVTTRLRTMVDEVIVVSSAELQLPSLDARVICDREPKLGPLGGIRDGLEAASADLCYATGTDVPFISAAFVEKMLSFGTAAAPVVDGFIQTLAAVYPKTLAPLASESIVARRMSLHALLEAVNFRRVLPAELPDLESIRNFNTLEEYEAAVRKDANG